MFESLVVGKKFIQFNNMSLWNNKMPLMLNLIFIVIECCVGILSIMEILAIDYGWEGRWNRFVLFAIICIQLLVLYLISEVPDPGNKRSLYYSHLGLILLVAIWLIFKTELHYKLR